MAASRFQKPEITFLTKRHRGDTRAHWETQPLTDLEREILRSQLGNHPQYVFTYIARGKKGAKGGTGMAASMFRVGGIL